MMKQVSILIDMSLRKIYTLTITVIGAVIISFSIDVNGIDHLGHYPDYLYPARQANLKGPSEI